MAKFDITEATIQALNNSKLEESMLSDMYDSLDDQIKDEPIDTSNVNGLVDDILVITDPDVSSEEYDEVIDRAKEIVKDTPEGSIPFDGEYIGQYAITCPICGATFVSDDILESGDTCPVCREIPEAFVIKGRLQTDEEIAEKYADVLNKAENEENDTNIVADKEEEEEEEEEELDKDTASKEVPQGNKLQESQLLEDAEYTKGLREKFISLIDEAESSFENDKLTAEEYEELVQDIYSLIKDRAEDEQIMLENKSIKTESEEFEVSELKKKAQEILPAEDIDTHDGDLYIKVSPKSTELLSHMKDKDSGLIKKFRSPIDENIWYEIPFANMQDDAKEKLGEDKSNGIVYTIKLNTKNIEEDPSEIKRVMKILTDAIINGDVNGQTFDKEGEKCLEFTSEEEIIKESLEQNEEEGWGEDVLEICEPFFEKVEQTMYEVRNAKRGSYAHFGDTVLDLAAWMGELSMEAEAVQSELDNMQEQLQESDIRQITPAEKKILDAAQTSDSKYNLDNIKVRTTPEGNLNIRTADDKDIVTIDRLSDDEMEDLRLNGYFFTDLDEESKVKTESVTTSQVIGWHNKIEDAEDADEIQKIIYTIDDNDLENQLQLAFDRSVEDEDDLELMKDFLIATLEDNAEYED